VKPPKTNDGWEDEDLDLEIDDDFQFENEVV